MTSRKCDLAAYCWQRRLENELYQLHFRCRSNRLVSVSHMLSWGLWRVQYWIYSVAGFQSKWDAFFLLLAHSFKVRPYDILTDERRALVILVFVRNNWRGNYDFCVFARFYVNFEGKFPWNTPKNLCFKPQDSNQPTKIKCYLQTSTSYKQTTSLQTYNNV